MQSDLIIARDRPEERPGHGSTKSACIALGGALKGILTLFSRRDYWLISAATFFRYGVYASIQALWAAPFLMTTMHLSQVMAGNLLLAISIGLILGGPISGWISDAMIHSRKKIIMAGINFFTMAGVAFFLHSLGWAINLFYPDRSLAPEAFRMAFVLFGGCLVFTTVLYGWTVDSIKKL